MARPAIRTIEDLEALDPTEVLEGYRDGRAGEPAPGGNRSPSYAHGWRNGAVDAGLKEKSAAQAETARIFHLHQSRR